MTLYPVDDLACRCGRKLVTRQDGLVCADCWNSGDYCSCSPLSVSLNAREHLHTPPPLASDLDILRRVVVHLQVCRGVVGEKRATRLLYLAFTSRLLDDPVNVVAKGLSSSGKSYVIESVASLMPPEAVYTMTAMSEKALIYLDEPLAHRTLVLYEAVALREGREKSEDNQTAYIVRSLLSEGHIRYPVVTRGKDGEYHTVVKLIPGPTNLITSTTSVSLHGENETRMISLPSNDSQAQTRAVLLGASAERKRASDGSLDEWHQLQRWLAQQPTRVVIPYATCVAAQIPPVAVRLRRDWNAVRSLIRAHALLHQVNRERDGEGAVIASLVDYRAVRFLVNNLIADAIGATVPASVKETVEAVTSTGTYVTVAEVARALGVERSAAQRRLSTAAEKGYITNIEDKRGRPARYVAADALPGETVVLPPATQVCTGACTHVDDTVSAGQVCDCTGVCRCAAEFTETERGDPSESVQTRPNGTADVDDSIPAVDDQQSSNGSGPPRRPDGCDFVGCTKPGTVYPDGIYCGTHVKKMRLNNG